MNIYISYITTDLAGADATEEYGDWWRESEFSVQGATLNEPENYRCEMFEVAFDVVVGDTVHVLSMIYSSGDSFGTETGLGEILWVFKDQTLAEDAKLYWEANDEFVERAVSFQVDGGKTVTMSNPAYGYFENCSSVDLHTFIITKEGS